MFKTLKSKIRETDTDLLIFGAIWTGTIAAVTALTVYAVKADQAETRQAIAEGRKVITIFGQKAII